MRSVPEGRAARSGTSRRECCGRIGKRPATPRSVTRKGDAVSYLVCVEEEGGRWIAHVPDLPGCYSWHADREKAIEAVPFEVEAYLEWCADRGMTVEAPSPPVVVGEIIRSWSLEEEDTINAFFASDRPPLYEEELPIYSSLMAATRDDLLNASRGLDLLDMDHKLAGERWSISGVLQHVASTEWWCMERLDLSYPWEDMPKDPFDRLAQVRVHLLDNLPALLDFGGVVTRDGEAWSARKVMRRVLWHERDHTEHIHKLRDRFR